MGDKVTQYVGILQLVECLHGLLQMVLGLVCQGLDLAFNGMVGVIMVAIIDNASLEFVQAVFIDDVINDGGKGLAGLEYADLLSG